VDRAMVAMLVRDEVRRPKRVAEGSRRRIGPRVYGERREVKRRAPERGECRRRREELFQMRIWFGIGKDPIGPRQEQAAEQDDQNERQLHRP